jgi:carboxypeptidase family protein
MFRGSNCRSIYVTTLCLSAVLFSARLQGQAVAIAQVSGTVTDQSGSAVPNAQVRMTEVDKALPHATVTDSGGQYALPNLPVGPYRLEVEAPGFKNYTQTGIVLQVGNNITLNVVLQVGSISEKIEVMANAQMVETQKTGVAQVIDEKRINDLPLNGRQATQLILLSGASFQPTGSNSMTGSKNYSSSTTISVGGGQVNGTAYLLDGGDNTDTMTNVNLPFPFPDALQEFSVETSALSARFGTHPGATVNVVTKSGSNAYHGNLFEYLRNGNVNARPFFAANHDSLKRNIFGATVGGKIIANKLFFFGGWQSTRNRSQPPTQTNFVPTALALTGDLSGMMAGSCQSSGNQINLRDPSNGNAPYGGNRIPPSQLNAAALKLASNYLPATADPCGRVQFGIPQTGDEDQIIGRIDFAHTAKHNMYGRYFMAQFSNPSVYDGKNLLTTTQPGNLERVQTATIGDTYSISPTMVNSFHATFSRRRDNRGPAENQIGPKDIGLNIFQKVPNFLLVTVTNYFSVGCGTCAPGHFNVNTFQFADDVDIIRGRHQIAFGVNAVRTQNNLISGFNENGTFTFNGNAQGTGNNIADFLTGRVNTFGQSNPTPDDLRQSIFGLYVQDSFKMNNRLTLSAGLRWEPFFPNTDKYGRGTFLDQARFTAGTISSIRKDAPPGLVFPGEPGYPYSLWDRHLMNFGPRVGLAWDPEGNGKSSLRVGGAILFDNAELFFDERKTTNPPYGGSITLTTPAGGFTNPYLTYPGGNPFPSNSFPVAGVYIQMPVHTQPTYMAQWNATYQRQFAGNWLASVSYIGNKTTHLWVGSEINPAVGSATASTGTTDQRRLLYLQSQAKGQFYGSINQADEGGNAHYNALLLSLQHRFGHGFTLMTNYTDSVCISDLDFTGELGGSPNSQPFNRGADRGPCNFDVRHLFNVSLVATSTVKSSNNWTNRLLSHWQIAPIVRAVSGRRFNVTSGTDNSRTGLNNDRPIVIGSNPYSSSSTCPLATTPCLKYLSAANVALAPNPVGTFGNVGRNAFRGPGSLNFDVTLSRSFPIAERYRLEARFEAFNVINHPNFENPAGALNNSNFGLITAQPASPSASALLPSIGDPRILQFALKFHF